jgi:multicomponent K+:H+ antiporter subunit A
VALVLQYMALGQAGPKRCCAPAGGRYTRWIGIGLGIAGLTGVGAFVFGRPFLTSAGHPVLPVLGELPLATRRCSTWASTSPWWRRRC